jgi:nucleotide-binding universal stress UspA family protein
MNKVIVVGTDGSPRAGIAVKEAIALAKLGGATLHVVHAVRGVTLRGEHMDPAPVVAANAAAYDEGKRICAQVATEAKREDVHAQIHNVDGDPADVLLKVSEAVSADLLVVGNRGMSGIKRFVLGSVPDKVSHHCPCSLLIVNTDAE